MNNMEYIFKESDFFSFKRLRSGFNGKVAVFEHRSETCSSSVFSELFRNADAPMAADGKSLKFMNAT